MLLEPQIQRLPLLSLTRNPTLLTHLKGLSCSLPCTHRIWHEHPLVPSMKLLETARSPRHQEVPENWEQREEKYLCSHGTTHAHARIRALLFPALSCWRISPRHQEVSEQQGQRHYECLCPHWTTLMCNQDTPLRKTQGLSRIYMTSTTPGFLNLVCILHDT